MELKERMNMALKLINEDLKSLRKEKLQAEKANKPYYTISDKIEKAEKQKKFYLSGKTEPVRFENGVVVNAKLVRAYLKKLPRSAVVTYELVPEGLRIRWVLKGRNRGQGNLNCLNIAHRYESFNLPAAEGLFE